ncbi:MAG: autoinducer binding domain-containing protein [Burkholderiaceae bacterium]|jgi:LuxR family transcriptional regulator|nr:autoinducer binding domain-containing protein [Burkholderiaceae bacterium]
MRNWQEDLLHIAHHNTMDKHDVFKRIKIAATALQFDYVAYGFESPYPFSRPKITLLNNYPRSWQENYKKEGYIRIDPTVTHGRRSRNPIIWSDQLFINAQNFWENARDHGLNVSWAQSILDNFGGKSMITLSRSYKSLTTKELEGNELKMRWLAQVAHFALSKFFQIDLITKETPLSRREVEVLKWSADGKSAQDIADILNLSKNTVDFHIKNSLAKLQAPNKTAAVIRAALTGLLN